MEQKQRMQASCAKAALWIGIVFWLVALSLALRLIYTGYAAIVPAQRYHAEPMTDGSWHIAIEGSPLAFSNVADHSLISSDENPANPKALHLILLGADLLVHTAVAYVLFLLRKMLSEISGGCSPFTAEYGADIRRMGYTVMGAFVLPHLLRVTLVGLFCQGHWSYSAGSMAAGILVGGLLVILARIIDYGALLQQESDQTL